MNPLVPRFKGLDVPQLKPGHEGSILRYFSSHFVQFAAPSFYAAGDSPKSGADLCQRNVVNATAGPDVDEHQEQKERHAKALHE